MTLTLYPHISRVLPAPEHPETLGVRTFFEVGEEERRLVRLHLPVLDGLSAERVVQLHGLDRRRAPLVLRNTTENTHSQRQCSVTIG